MPAGTVSTLLTAVKGLTLSNALVIILLLAAAIPAYALYKLVNDQALLDRVMSTYEEVDLGATSSCTLRAAGQRGLALTWYISTGFAYHGDDRWTIGVGISRKPTMEEMKSYCDTLLLVVDFLHDPDHVAPGPPFPGTNEPLIRKYRRGQGE